MSKVESKGSKPWWWKPLWIFTLLTTIVSGVVGVFLFDIPFASAVGGVTLTFLCIGFAYYIRVRPSIRVNRAIYILLGIPIGFVLRLIFSFIFNRVLITSASGTLPLSLLSGAVCYGLGALIGDWIGKRRNYILPMTP